ncbi:MAG: hypothetical protein OXH11_18730 [Candidatus Aminicenantes bacterium]|nr:hypothetical protein [Candidatus Aminicenantes bacterium]
MNRLLMVLLMSTAVSTAHTGDRLFPFYELTDEMLATIDIHDGFIDEWYDVGEPSMTVLDCRTWRDEVLPDPSNLDFRIWLAWHDESNRIFFAIAAIDDDYVNTHDRSSGNLGQTLMYEHDSIAFQLDADHSGGTGHRNETPAEEYPIIFGRTQQYTAVAQTASGPLLGEGTLGSGEPSSWKINPPYGDAGGGVHGENPTMWVIEFYVTPQNAWGEGPENTFFSDLEANQIVGFVAIVRDRDFTKGSIWKPSSIQDDENPFQLDRGYADIFVDGLLLPDRSTAVEDVTWGRIKASLQVD